MLRFPPRELALEDLVEVRSSELLPPVQVKHFRGANVSASAVVPKGEVDALDVEVGVLEVAVHDRDRPNALTQQVPHDVADVGGEGPAIEARRTREAHAAAGIRLGLVAVAQRR